MTKQVIGLLKETKKGWSFRIGNEENKWTHGDGLPNIEIAYQKMREAKINPDAILIDLVEIKAGLIGYDFYKYLFR